MGRPEAAFRTKLKTLLRKFRPVSIENALCTPGLPDLALTTGWAELKCLPKWPARRDTPVRIPHFTEDQKRWAREWVAAGGRYWLIVKVAGELFVFDADSAQRVGNLTRQAMCEEAMAWFQRWPTSEQLCPVFEPTTHQKYK